MYRYLSTSIGDGNLTPAIEITKVEPNIDTYLPREGPETKNHPYNRTLDKCIDTYLPREGPEKV